MASRSESDEHYVLDLCDQILGMKCSRQHRFPWLLGDPSPTTGRQVALPVDGYWEQQHLVVEFAESQHSESTPFFDKPDVLTVSGVHRGTQRAIYDDRRRRLIPEHGIDLVVIAASEFPLKGKRIDRDRERDLGIVSSILSRAGADASRGTGAPDEGGVSGAVPGDVSNALRHFVAERDWGQFHTPVNLAKSISIEAGELLECFQWHEAAERERVVEELADVLTYCHLLADRLGVDPGRIILDKLAQTRSKYPVDRSRGRSAKYDQL